MVQKRSKRWLQRIGLTLALLSCLNGQILWADDPKIPFANPFTEDFVQKQLEPSLEQLDASFAEGKNLSELFYRMLTELQIPVQELYKKRHSELAAEVKAGKITEHDLIDALISDARKERFVQEVPGLGEARLSFIESDKIETDEGAPSHWEPIVRILHRDSDVSFVIYNPFFISMDDKHMQQFVARQLIDSGSRAGLSGRNVLVLALDPKFNFADPEKLEKLNEQDKKPTFAPMARAVAKPSPLSFQFYKQYWKATYVKPSKADKFVIGPFDSGVQFSIAMGLSYARSHLDPSYQFTIAPAILAGIWGLIFGVWKSTYRQWLYRGKSKVESILPNDSPLGDRFTHWMNGYQVRVVAKSLSVSLSYAIPLVGITEGWNALNLFTIAGAATWGRILFNSTLNNINKTGWLQIPASAEQVHLYDGTINVPFPFTYGRGLDFKKANVYSTLWNYVPHFFKSMDLIFIGAPSIGGVLPPSLLLLAFSIYVGRFALMKYTQHLVTRVDRNNRTALYEARKMAALYKYHWELMTFQRLARSMSRWYRFMTKYSKEERAQIRKRNKKRQEYKDSLKKRKKEEEIKQVHQEHQHPELISALPAELTHGTCAILFTR